MKAELLIVDGPNAGQTIPLEHDKFIIGRESDCHLRPESDMVSRHHCVFLQNEFALRIRDLGSTNGTYINGSRVEGEVPLSHGDTLSVGNLTLRVVMRPAAALGSETSGNGTAGSETSSSSQTIVYEGDTVHDPDQLPLIPTDTDQRSILPPSKTTPAPGPNSTD